MSWRLRASRILGSALQPLLIVVLAALVVTLTLRTRALRAQADGARARNVEPKGLAYVPAYRASSLDGDSLTIGERSDSGRQLLVFFTTTCRFCAASVPAWRRLTKLADTGSVPTRVIGISLDTSVTKLREYVHKNQLAFPIVQLPPGKYVALYRAHRVPVSMLVNYDGKVVYTRMGVVDTKAVEDSLAAAMTWGGRSARSTASAPLR